MGILSHETTPPIPYELPGRTPRPPLEAHLMNFFDAIYGNSLAAIALIHDPRSSISTYIAQRSRLLVCTPPKHCL